MSMRAQAQHDHAARLAVVAWHTGGVVGLHTEAFSRAGCAASWMILHATSGCSAAGDQHDSSDDSSQRFAELAKLQLHTSAG